MFIKRPTDVIRITRRTLGPRPSVTLVITIGHSFLIVLVNDSLTTHFGSVFAGYLNYDYSRTLCFSWFIHSHDPFHFQQSIVLSAHSFRIISPYSWLTCTNMVHALVPRVVYIAYGLVLYSVALISLERPSSPTALQTLGARIPGTSDYMLRTFEMYPQHLSNMEPLRKFW